MQAMKDGEDGNHSPPPWISTDFQRIWTRPRRIFKKYNFSGLILVLARRL